MPYHCNTYLVRDWTLPLNGALLMRQAEEHPQLSGKAGYEVRDQPLCCLALSGKEHNRVCLEAGCEDPKEYRLDRCWSIQNETVVSILGKGKAT